MAFGFSEYGYVVRMPSTPLLTTAQAPASAGQFRDSANNAEILADEAGQVWACTGIRSGVYVTVDGTSITDPQHLFRVGPFPIRTRPGSTRIGTSSSADGGPYKLRVRIGGQLSGANGTGTFYAVAGPPDDPAGPPAELVAGVVGGASMPAWMVSASTTSTTEALLTTSANTLALPTSMIARFRTSWRTVNSDTLEETVDVYPVVVDFYAYATGTGMPRLSGFYVAEFVG